MKEVSESRTNDYRRVVLVSLDWQRQGRPPWQPYAQSTLAASLVHRGVDVVTPAELVGRLG